MTENTSAAQMTALLEEHDDIRLPEVGTVVEGTVISAANNEVHVNMGGIATGVVRGPELIDESGMFTDLRPGDEVAATVLELENEMGELELSFREAGHQKAWEALDVTYNDKEVVQGEVVDANKGGLIIRLGGVTGFLPVSQLTVEHYPRVEGANKQKILEKLQSFVGEKFDLMIIDVDEAEGKLIFSEKAAKLDEQSELLEKFSVGDVVEGRVTGVVDFGAFVEFAEGLEGLVHISELAWQRIDNPKDIIAVNDTVKAQIIQIDSGKISLSVRRLQQDPWAIVAEKYKVGDTIKGRVLKINPFGAFVELDPEIHGLAHISELSWKKIDSPEDVLEVDQEAKFKIVSIEPANHRLGLSLKQMTEKPADAKSEAKPAASKSVVAKVADAKEESAEKAEEAAPAETPAETEAEPATETSDEAAA